MVQENGLFLKQKLLQKSITFVLTALSRRPYLELTEVKLEVKILLWNWEWEKKHFLAFFLKS